MTKRTEFFTVVARNYLAYALVLGNSIRQHHPVDRFSIFLLDDVNHKHQTEIESAGFCVIYPEDAGIENYKQLVFKYDLVEACTAVKPFVIHYLLEHGAGNVIYLDPDIQCFRPLIDVVDQLEDHSIVITPHSTTPVTDHSFPDDTRRLMEGVYNLGFVAISNCDEGRAFVKWWMSRLESFCLNSVETGLFVDQKWIDLVPAFFPKVHVLRHRGYNIAVWNLHERELVQSGDQWIVFQTGDPVTFVHFSGARVNHPERITNHDPKNPFSRQLNLKQRKLADVPGFAVLFKNYLNQLMAAKSSEYSAYEYAFNNYDNGEFISQLERRLYWSLPEWQKYGINPFSVDKNSFWQHCRKKGIRASKTLTGDFGAVGIVEKYKFPIAMIKMGIRLLLYFLGPNMYVKFSRYMREQFVLAHHQFLLDD